jgi:peptidoglycan/xylan/chitin deacetylase (PgdA/CDA1 family)
MKNSKLKLYRFVLLTGMICCSAQVNAQNLLNLPEPAAGTTRYATVAEVEKKWPSTHGAGSICFWGDDKFAAVSLTIDDNNYPDVTFWRQVSAEFGWKLTWFLIVYPGMWDIYNNVPGNNIGYNGSAAQWKTLYDEGHEIGLHGNCGSMNELSEAGYQEHMELGIAHLESVISNNIVSYAYPCGTVDSPTASSGYRNVCSNMFIGARGTTGGSTSPFTGDYMNTHSMGASFSQAWFDLMEDSTRTPVNSLYRGWAVFLWHGLLGDTNKIAGAYQVFNYLAANEDKYWIKKFGEVARYAQERESGVLNITSVAADQIQFTLTDSMTNSLFNYPLTVKFRVDNWADAVAVQNGQSIPVSLMTYSNSTYALVQAVPDQGTVVLSKAASAFRPLRGGPR